MTTGIDFCTLSLPGGSDALVGSTERVTPTVDPGPPLGDRAPVNWVDAPGWTAARLQRYMPPPALVHAGPKATVPPWIVTVTTPSEGSRPSLWIPTVSGVLVPAATVAGAALR